jgi:FlaA1/EpsC-like NDP-sugar epimerase
MDHEARYLTLLKICYRVVDAVVVGLALFLAYQIRFEWRVPADSAHQMWLFLPVLMIGQVAINWAFGTYRLIWRYIGLTDAVAAAPGL